MRSARLANFQHAGVARSEQVWLLRPGSAPSRGCIATGKVRDQQAWPLVSGVLVLAVLSREEHCSEVQRLRHVVQGCLPCATCAATNRRPLPSHCCSGRRWRGKRTHSVEMPPRKDRGVDPMGSDATLQNVGEIRARMQNGKVHKPNDICEVTRRRQRVSPCRSSPWCYSLSLSLRRRRREAALLFPES